MKIIVTTDYSGNSKSGIRMAVSLASQLQADLHFLNIAYIPGRAGESAQQYQKRLRKEIAEKKTELTSFIRPFIKGIVNKKKIVYQVEHSFIPETGIVNYQKKIKADLICISTRGAGRMPKLFGTTAGNLITYLTTPLLVVPSGYSVKPVTTIVCFNDLENLVNELNQLAHFSDLLTARLKLVYFAKSSQITEISENIKRKLKRAGLTTSYEVLKRGRGSIVSNLLKYSENKKPSLIVLFSRQRKSFIQRLFNSSRTMELAFHTRYPLLVFHKK